ncbi:GGDEF domain-containing protein [Sulfurimonas lithotrophica]|uniref:diguanylate cyclase n=1 Tax=Sulfurimonas lithotrophica TaxID=2590022 RepID=A0A5P8P191_9BACT|nr:sensor domain-containing diguanylate cyclase [Sulfurimonas lithotrophica]QFR49444.1 GGDEF domain-containing protein [Sulfurimonas lithotrophica]
MDLKLKIITMIAALLLGVSIIGSIINYKKDIDSTQAQLKNISLPLSVDNIYTEVQHRMIKPLIVSSLMANDTFLRDWLIDGEKDISSVQKYLKEIQAKYGAFTSFLVSDKTKNYYHSKGLIDTINEKNVADDWYFKFINSKNLYEVNLDVNKNFSDSLIMFINYKVKDYKEKLLAVTGVGIKLVNIESMLESFKKRYKYDVYFVNKEGEIILHTKEFDKRGNISSIEELNKLQSSIKENKQNKYEYTYKDNNYLLQTKYIKELHLYLFVEVNKQEYMNDLNEMFYLNLLISIVVTLLTILIIIHFINIYQNRLEKIAHEDALTGLDNRRKFNDDIEAMFENFYRGNIESLTLVILDIDNFKQVNDSFGHLTGDKVLIRFAEILKESLRKSDFVARWGGEEFSILLINSSEDEAQHIAEKIRFKIKEDTVLNKLLNKSVTASFGIGKLKNNESIDAFISKVDSALYEAKSTGKDKIIYA